jgi:hypothetical protein
MRHIAYEARLARLATYYFGPLVLAGWSLVGKKKSSSSWAR